MPLRRKHRTVDRGEVDILRALVRLANQLQSSLELDAVVRVVATAAAETFGFREATVYIRDSQSMLFRAHATLGLHPAVDERIMSTPVPEHIFEELFDDRFGIGSSYFLDHRRHTWTEEQQECLPPIDLGWRREGEWHSDDRLFVPLFDPDRRLMGVLDLFDPADKGLPTLDLVKPLEVFATHAAVAIENARQYERLQRTSRELGAQVDLRHELLRLSDALLSTLDEHAVFEQITAMLKSIVDFDTMDIRLVDEAAGELVAIYARDENAEQMLEFRQSLGVGVAGWVARHNEAQLVNDMVHDPRGVIVPGTEPEPQASIIVPMNVRGKVTGVLCLDRLGGAAFEEHELEPAELFANLAAIAIQNARSYEEMERQAISDGLTGIHNYRHFRERLKSDVSRAARYGETFCLLMMDLDHFKQVNDTVGHQRGDDVLRAVADVLRTCSRESDYLARYGGEEFVMILPRSALGEARNMGERICALVREIDAGSADLHVSMSIGVAAFPQSAVDSDGVLGAADAALLRAKARGRDRVCLFTDEEETVTNLEGKLVELGRRFAERIGLSDVETSALVTALAVHEFAGSLHDDVHGILGARTHAAAADSGPTASLATVRSLAFNALLHDGERWDGHGYPDGLKGTAIPRVARALAVCRSYAAEGDDGNGERLKRLRARASHELDPRLVQLFLGVIREGSGEPSPQTGRIVDLSQPRRQG
jgi:diguanylate cyclase (GGDEF)-like protein